MMLWARTWGWKKGKRDEKKIWDNVERGKAETRTTQKGKREASRSNEIFKCPEAPALGKVTERGQLHRHN